MSNQTTLQQMTSLRLSGMKQCFQSYLDTRPQWTADQLIAHLLQSEQEFRSQRRIHNLIKKAQFTTNASITDIDFQTNRNLDKNILLRLAQCKFIDEKHNIIITGPTGVGKSYIAAAIGHQACLNDFKTTYVQAHKFFRMLIAAKADQSYSKIIERLAKQQLLIIDDFGLQNISQQQACILFEVIEDRTNKSATIITSQIPTQKWHQIIEDDTIADALLDRLVHNAYRIELKGESLRKIKAKNNKA